MFLFFLCGVPFQQLRLHFDEQLIAVKGASLPRLLDMPHCCLLGLSCLTAEKTLLVEDARNFSKEGVRKKILVTEV